MDTPTRTTNLPAVSAIDEVVGNVTQDGVARTRRISVQSLAQQLGGTDGTIADGAVTTPKLAAGAVTSIKRADTLVGRGGDPTGTIDITSILAAASPTNEYLVLSPGTYLVDDAAEIPSGLTVVAQNGALLTRGASGSLQWDGGLIALGGDRQQIFDATWITGAYTRIGDTPYPIALVGNPQIEAANPFWFGIIEGDAVTGAANILQNDYAMHLAAYWGRKVRVPRASIRIPRFDLRQDDMLVYGHGADSKLIICDATDLPAAHRAGSVVAIAGDPPTTASGPAARYTSRSRFEKLGIDGGDQTNINGVGVSFVDGVGASEITFFNVGRKALTAQYHCHGTRFEGCLVEEAVTEPSPTQAALSTEGQVSGLDFTVTGGVSSTNDLLGQDMTDNRYEDIRIKYSGFGIITTTNAIDTRYDVYYSGDTISTATHIIEARTTYGTKIRYRGAGNTSRRFIFCDTDTKAAEIDAKFGDNVSALADGYSIHVKGQQHRIKAEFDHSNTAVSQAVFVEGPRNEFDRLHVKSNDALTTMAIGAGASFTKLFEAFFETPNSRAVSSTAPNTQILGGYFDTTTPPGGAPQGINLGGANAVVHAATIKGTAAARINLGSGCVNSYIVGNALDGGSATIVAAMECVSTSAIHSNTGDTSSADNLPLARNNVWADTTGAVRRITGARVSDTGGTAM